MHPSPNAESLTDHTPAPQRARRARGAPRARPSREVLGALGAPVAAGAARSGVAIEPAKERTEEDTHERGRWRASPGSLSGGGAASLTWEGAPRPWARVVRGVRLPTAIGVLVFVVAIAVTAVIVLRSLGDDPAIPAHGFAPEAIAGDAASLGETAPLDATGAAGSDVLMVHVIGEVKRPGVVELSVGARVLDAIEAAGGATERAALSAVNLARTVTDGEQIEVLDAESAASAQQQRADGGLASVPSAPLGGGGGSGVVNVNTASPAELTALSGIGPALAERIVAWREANGRFADVDQLLDVSGIGEKTLDRFRDRVAL